MGTQILSLALLCGSACGYQSIHTARPFGVETLHVEAFQENAIAGIAPELRSHLIQRFAAAGTRLTSHVSGSEAILQGIIEEVSVDTHPVNTGTAARIPAYALTVRISAGLRHGDDVLWRFEREFRETFLPGVSSVPGANPASTEANRHRALSRLAQAAADAIHTNLVLSGTL